MKPRLYIDVDGVLFGLYGGDYFQLRPGVVPFLAWADKHFECIWLTAWFDRANDLMRHIYSNARFPVARWDRNKTEGIERDKPWWWIDDDLLDRERVVLKRWKALDRHIRVNPKGRDELFKVQRKLAAKVRSER